jgi:hypothetical protein
MFSDLEGETQQLMDKVCGAAGPARGRPHASACVWDRHAHTLPLHASGGRAGDPERLPHQRAAAQDPAEPGPGVRQGVACRRLRRCRPRCHHTSARCCPPSGPALHLLTVAALFGSQVHGVELEVDTSSLENEFLLKQVRAGDTRVGVGPPLRLGLHTQRPAPKTRGSPPSVRRVARARRVPPRPRLHACPSRHVCRRAGAGSRARSSTRPPCCSCPAPQMCSSEATALSRPASDFVRRNTQLGKLGTVATVATAVGRAVCLGRTRGGQGGGHGAAGARWCGGASGAAAAAQQLTHPQ